MEYAGQFAWMRFFGIAPPTELQGIKTNNDINVDMIKYVLAFKCADSNSHIADVPLHPPLFAEASGYEESLKGSRGWNNSRSRGTSLPTQPVGSFCILHSMSCIDDVRLEIG